MPESFPLLDQVRIASPCSARWEEMSGDDVSRFCGHCRLNVYNLSALSPGEAEQLLREREGRLCVRFYRRRDGTVLTRNCPVGVARVRRQFLATAFGIAGFFGAIPALASLWQAKFGGKTLRQHEPIKSVMDRFDPQPPPVLMGAVAAPVQPRSNQ